ncbi:amidohydrolase [Solimicrobium silvestre]|uniref:Amidohydrolases: amidohydrolase n=1 Tax=Solimicrobium silvestre TaxID=2099400 RepID=A0A2S9H0V7_9BURK|nr:amidohydrolase [Solimicrobium silvestre]PRC93496.1 amidohydrolases: amidohydrolase [Solimicrobium silvestre]
MHHLKSGINLAVAIVLTITLSTSYGDDDKAFSPLNQIMDHQLNSDIAELVNTYKDIHSHPELSHHEQRTSEILASELRKAGYKVTERVGKYPDGSQAFGVVAILENGPGPRLLLRADMDALPIIEETGVSYASHVKSTNAAGQEVGVMHACGHDVHVTTMIGTARALAANRSSWHGTLMLIGQPSEETLDGAKAMLADHLYERFGTPDMVIMLHDTNTLAAGTVSVSSGNTAAAVTSIDVTMRGVGGHGARPHATIDPVVMAGEFIVQLQTIVSRQQDPLDPAVVTIGDIRGGTKRNIIPDEVKMELTTRAYSDKAMKIIIDGVKRTAQGVALSAGVPEDRQPIVTVLKEESGPALFNDPALSNRVKSELAIALGASNVSVEPPIMGSEDFGNFGLPDRQIPVVMFRLGAMDPAKFAAAQKAGKPLPGPHTSHFEPTPELTLRTGVTAMTSVAVSLLQL